MQGLFGLPQESDEFVGGLTAMAVVVLFGQRQLCEAPGFAVGDEDGVIAEAVVAGGCFEDMAFAGSFEEVLTVVPDEGDDGTEAGAAVRLVFEAMQEEAGVVLVGAVGAREAGAQYAGLAAERVYFETGVFTKAVLAGDPMDSGGFFERVCFEGIVGFGNIDVDACIAEGDDVQDLPDGGLDLFDLVGIIGRKDDGGGHTSKMVLRQTQSLLFSSLLSSVLGTSWSRPGVER